MLIAWHPSRWWDWCVPDDKKKREKNCGHKTQTFLYLMTRYEKMFNQKELKKDVFAVGL